MTHGNPERIDRLGEIISLDGAMFAHDRTDGRWHLEADDGNVIDGELSDWIALANHIMAIDEIERRIAEGEIASQG